MRAEINARNATDPSVSDQMLDECPRQRVWLRHVRFGCPGWINAKKGIESTGRRFTAKYCTSEVSNTIEEKITACLQFYSKFFNSSLCALKTAHASKLHDTTDIAATVVKNFLDSVTDSWVLDGEVSKT
tara:strand:- start:6 stop:392 length:387 start_codon:yes stop_codon:yes gene_type:complete